MNRRRYDGYRAVRGAITRRVIDEHAADVLGGLAEGLLLARDDAEAQQAVDRVPEGLMLLVDRGELSRFAAHRFWALLRQCGPRMAWPTSWDRQAAASR
jgi:hypothetical protein